MPLRTRSQGLHPPPSLPIEMKRAILSFCDAPTLAKASLVSVSFLELASPFLYKNIVIYGLQHFEKLFYEEVSIYLPLPWLLYLPLQTNPWSLFPFFSRKQPPSLPTSTTSSPSPNSKPSPFSESQTMTRQDMPSKSSPLAFPPPLLSKSRPWTFS